MHKQGQTSSYTRRSSSASFSKKQVYSPKTEAILRQSRTRSENRVKTKQDRLQAPPPLPPKRSKSIDQTEYRDHKKEKRKLKKKENEKYKVFQEILKCDF